MHFLQLFVKKLMIFFTREKFDADLQEEMSFHRQQKIQALQSVGFSAEDARHAANREFGNDLLLRERSHDPVALWFEVSLQDFRFALKSG